MKFLQHRDRSTDCSPHRYFFDLHYSVLESRKRVEKQADRIAKTLSEIHSVLNEILKQGDRVLAAEKRRHDLYSETEERKLVSNFLAGENGICDLITMFTEIKNSAVCDPELDGLNEKRVVDGCKGVIKSLKELFLTTQRIRWEVMHKAEGVDEVASSQSTEDFIAGLQ